MNENEPCVSPASLLLLLLLLALPFPGVHAAHAGAAPQPDTLEQTIDFLIKQVATSGYTFIRNSQEYDSREAAGHMEKKYRHFHDRITTVDDFIELAASRSLLSGQPYLVLREDGTTMRTGAWLRDMLAAYCAQPDSRCAD